MVQLSILANSRLFREALAGRLADQDWVQLVSVAGTVYDLLLGAQARPINVLLVYLDIESAVGAEVVRNIKTLLPATRIVVLGCEQGDAEMLRWIEAGAMAGLEEGTSWAGLLETIRSVIEGRATCSSGVVSRVANRIEELESAGSATAVAEQEPLTDCEFEVCQLIALGLMNKQVARHLGVKRSTVSTHLRSILRKRGAKRQRDLI